MQRQTPNQTQMDWCFYTHPIWIHVPAPLSSQDRRIELQNLQMMLHRQETSIWGDKRKYTSSPLNERREVRKLIRCPFYPSFGALRQMIYVTTPNKVWLGVVRETVGNGI